MGNPAHLLKPHGRGRDARTTLGRGGAFTFAWVQQMGNIAHRTDSLPSGHGFSDNGYFSQFPLSVPEFYLKLHLTARPVAEACDEESCNHS